MRSVWGSVDGAGNAAATLPIVIPLRVNVTRKHATLLMCLFSERNYLSVRSIFACHCNYSNCAVETANGENSLTHVDNAPARIADERC